ASGAFARQVRVIQLRRAGGRWTQLQHDGRRHRQGAGGVQPAVGHHRSYHSRKGRQHIRTRLSLAWRASGQGTGRQGEARGAGQGGSPAAQDPFRQRSRLRYRLIMKLASHLNPKLFEKDIERVANRDGFGEGLVEAAENNPAVIALTADLVESTRVEAFSKKFPERFIEVGVAEQNLASVASGLAAVGKIPFITSYAMFSPGRNWEQIRTTIAYNDQNVKVIGAHSGISVGPDGATHQAIEDIAIMRAMPNMIVLAPADFEEAKAATIFAAEYDGPVYIRLGRSPVASIFTKELPFALGKAELLAEMTEHRKNAIGIVST